VRRYNGDRGRGDNGRLDWNSEIQKEEQEERVVLPEGDAIFTVVELSQGTSSRTGHPMARLKLRLKSDDGETVTTENLVLADSCRWKLWAFFKSIGQAKPADDSVQPRWHEVIGATGRCRITIEDGEYKGKQFRRNQVDRFLPPEDTSQEEPGSAGAADSEGKTAASATGSNEAERSATEQA